MDHEGRKKTRPEVPLPFPYILEGLLSMLTTDELSELLDSRRAAPKSFAARVPQLARQLPCSAGPS